MNAADPHPLPRTHDDASRAAAEHTGAEADPATTLARWQADEAAIRARAAGPSGVLGVEHRAARAGVELFAAMLAGEAPRPPMGETLDYILVAAEPGKAIFQGRPQARFYNPMGTVHGGWYATLLDSALGCAVHAALPAGRAYTTLELKLNLVRALTAAVPLVRAEAQVLHLGRQTATAEARLVGPDGRLYAHGTTTCLVFDLPPTPHPG